MKVILNKNFNFFDRNIKVYSFNFLSSPLFSLSSRMNFSTSSQFLQTVDNNNNKDNLFKSGEAFSSLYLDRKSLNLSSDAHYLHRIARILYYPDLTLERKQFYIEECLLNYFDDHFKELIYSNPENFKYSKLTFKLFHEHYPKFIKLLNVFLKSDIFLKKPNLKILADLKLETIASKVFVIIISNISGGKVIFVSLSMELGKNIRAAYAKKKSSDSEGYLAALSEIDNSPEITISVGNELIHLFIESTKLITKENEKVGINETEVIISPSNDLTKMAVELGFVKDLLLPMVVPPVDWEIDRSSTELINGNSITNGMYLFNSLNSRNLPIPLIKNSKDNYGKTFISSNFVDNVNRLAAVPFKINVEVLKIVETLLESRSEVCNGALLFDLHEWTDLEKIVDKKTGEERKLTLDEQKEVQEHNSQYLYQMQIINIARTYAYLDKFYLPINADWRGRVYTLPAYLTYQGTDLAKSLINFAHPDPISDDKLSHLKRYGANLYGMDKTSLNNRLSWISSKSSHILDLDLDFIMKADEPFCFLAFAVEYKNWLSKKETVYLINVTKEKISSPEPTPKGTKPLTKEEQERKEKRYKKELKISITSEEILKEFSSLPIYQDATCNGIQHLAALSRDSNVAPLVNLTESNSGDSPQDIYSYVIPFIETELKDLAKKDKDNEVFENFKLSRSLVKKPIMTIPYSVTVYRIAEYLENEFKIVEKGKGKNKIVIYITDQGLELTKKNVFKLASVIYKTFFKLFPNINSFVNKLREIAQFTNSLESGIVWSTPSGILIEQNYKSFEPLKIRCSFKNKKYQVTLRRASAEINLKKQISAFLPNLIHSLDSSNLILFVENFNSKFQKKDAYPNIITVHDCFATSIGKVELMEKSVRESFVNIYNNPNLFREFTVSIFRAALENYMEKIGKTYEDVLKVGDEIKVPESPKLGTYNVKEVLKSKYFIN